MIVALGAVLGIPKLRVSADARIDLLVPVAAACFVTEALLLRNSDTIAGVVFAALWIGVQL